MSQTDDPTLDDSLGEPPAPDATFEPGGLADADEPAGLPADQPDDVPVADEVTADVLTEDQLLETGFAAEEDEEE